MARQTPTNKKGKQLSDSGEAGFLESPNLPLFLVMISFVVYATGLRNGMVSMDDHSATVDNPAVTGFDFFSSFNLGMYAPVTWFFYGIAYLLGKDQAFWYHLLGALVHAANVWLLFRLLERLKINRAALFFTAAFFALHPIQVESVSWIAAFSTPLASLFMLLSLDYYVRQSTDQPWGLNLGISLLFMGLAGLSKSIAVSVPLMLFALDFWLKRPVSLKNFLPKLPYFALALGFGMLTLYSRNHIGEADAPIAFDGTDRFLMVFQTLAFYVSKLLWPAGLSIWYPFEKTGGGWDLTYYVAPLLVAAVSYIGFRLRNRYPELGFGLLFFLAGIVFTLPFATLGTFEMRADRYNYLPCIGIFFALSGLPAYLKQVSPSYARAAGNLLIAGLFLFSILTFMRIRDWKNTVTLIDRAIASSGDNFGKAYLWRGMEFGLRVTQSKDSQSASRFATQALRDFSKAIEINPMLTEAYKYRGGLYGVVKNYEASVADLTVYLERNPNSAEYYYNRGLSLLNLKRTQAAIDDFSKCIEINPAFDKAYRARGNAYESVGDRVNGAADLEKWRDMTGLEQ